jgi:uncharacterized protein (DUF2141 family)
LPLALEVDYFRLEKDKYFVPISVKVPGSALVFRAKGAKQATELDFVAEVLDARNRAAATVRDTIPLKLSQDVAGQVSQKSIQYDTGVTLTPGNYKLRFVARENGEGKVGTFETPFAIPDLGSRKTLRTSSLVVSTGREPVTQQVAGVKNDKKSLAANPLIANGEKLVPNVTKVFRPGQTMFVYLEVYDPTLPEGMPQTFQMTGVEARLALYDSDKKVFESQPVRAGRAIENRPGTVPVRMNVPLAKLSAGRYECQLTVIDQFGRKFAFPRTAVAIAD